MNLHETPFGRPCRFNLFNCPLSFMEVMEFGMWNAPRQEEVEVLRKSEVKWRMIEVCALLAVKNLPIPGNRLTSVLLYYCRNVVSMMVLYSRIDFSI